MAKNIILEHEEVVQVVSALKESNISAEIMTKFQEMMDREDKNYYKSKKGILYKDGFSFRDYMSYDDKPLKYEFKIGKVTNIRDCTKTLVEALSGSYYIQLKKDGGVFAHRWEAKLHGYNIHIQKLKKREKTLKTEKGKKPYIEMIEKIEKKIKYIEDHPEKLI